MNQRPVAIGLLLCEQVIIEEGTRNFTPVNCFSRRTVKGFPSEPVPFVVFALLTDGMGTLPIEILVQSLDDMEQIYSRTFSCQFPNPLNEYRFHFRSRDCTFPAPGAYQVSLVADGKPSHNADFTSASRRTSRERFFV